MSHCPTLGPCLAFALSSDAWSLVFPEPLTTGLEIWFDMVCTARFRDRDECVRLKRREAI
jgi:hypothetical protein